MKALQNIQYEAQQIVLELADRQINGMKAKYNEFRKWMSIENNPVVSERYNGEQVVNEYDSAHKYVYMTMFKRYNHELQGYYLPTHYPSDYKGQREMAYSKDLLYVVYELQLQQRGGWEARYREDFIGQNMAKLNRALAKHIDDNMSASDIKVNIGGDGAEVIAIVDGKIFRTFGTLCGGYVQCLHYRYRSSLK
tara:strand:- start:322 stop:903 length:582 start_codon:yes stop_codon:yes gene_type:complete